MSVVKQTFCNFASKNRLFMKSTMIFIFFMALLNVAVANETATDSVRGTFQRISAKEHAGGGTIRFHHDQRIERVVSQNTPATSASAVAAAVSQTPTVGFRVQVFSSNRQRVAKDEAFKLEAKLTEAFPTIGVYVSYTSPFWRVRLGNFSTMEEARVFTEELLRKFPNLRTDTYTVRERIIR